MEHPDEVRALVRRTAPALIVNAAAYTAVDAAEHDRERCGRINADAPEALAEEAARLGALIVHFSTNYVFDGASTHPYVEGDATAPLNVYGVTKAQGERAVANANPAHLILRTAGVYGRTGRNFMLRILDLAREREELQVVDDQLVAPTPASAVADATVAILRQVWGTAASSGAFGTFHLTSAGATSWWGFANRILALRSSREGRGTTKVRAVTSEALPGAARRPLNGLLNNDKIAQEFGVVLPDWEEALRLTLAGNANRSREA